jgi:serine/threonine protein kinase/tetratricopeptide (TPR) repeat protein
MGQVIGNRYEIQQELGAGGMGTVYLGIDRQSQASVAIKQLKKELAQPEMLERFQREGQALRDLNHPNIVKLLDAVEDAGKHFLIMEYVAGGDLKQLLEKGKLPYQRTLNIAIDLADALTRAHRLNIIHRDLKPANVLVAEDGTIRLTDFGVAHVIDKERVTETNAIVGTLDYLPPEAINGDPVDNRSDIWAFGVMLFEMLAGKRPFSTGSILQTMHAILTAPIPDLEELAPDAPIALVDLVYRMLARDPQARISSVRFVGAELEEILQGRDSRPMTRRFETPIPDFRQRPKHNLPAQTTPFVGRENELTELGRILNNPSIRLITILAQGGMGKTRLSLEAAERQIANFEHGVYFVELAPLSDEEGILPAIASALGYQFQSDGREPKQQVLDFLQAKELLLVLDNFEHLLAGAGLVSDLLKAAPKLKILVTSRQRLDQAGESLFHLSGMDFPKWETPADALDYAAVKLFMNSATRAKPDFELTKDNLDVVARICKLVQGMPLGIVLAASWLGMLSPKEVSDELQKGLDFLESDSQQIPERQRSMRAVMAYSWQQMSAGEQEVFAKLSVFRGGFTREAAEAIAGANLRILMSLVNKSLLYRDSATGRYEIHELLRQYAEEKGDINASQNAHSAYFASWLKAREADLKGSRDLEAVKAIRLDFENVKTAWAWAVESQKLTEVEQSVGALIEYFTIVGAWREGQQLFRFALNLKTDEILYSKILTAVYVTNWHHYPQVDKMRECLNLARKNLNPEWQATILGNLAMALSDREEFAEAQVFADDALALLVTSNNRFWYARANFAKFYVLVKTRTFESIKKAKPFIQKAYDLVESLGNSSGKSFVLYNIGVIHAFELEYELALQAFQERLLIIQAYNNAKEIAHTYMNIFVAYTQIGNYQEAYKAGQARLDIAKEYELHTDLYSAYSMLAEILSLMGQHEQAKSQAEALAEYSQALELDSPWKQVSLAAYHYSKGMVAFRQKDYMGAIEAFKQFMELNTNSDVFHFFYMGLAELRLGYKQTAKKHFRKALPLTMWLFTSLHALYGHAELAWTTADKSRAVEYATLVFEHKATEYEFREYARELLEKLQTEMPKEDYQAAYERGKSLDLETVVQEILAETDQ